MPKLNTKNEKVNTTGVDNKSEEAKKIDALTKKLNTLEKKTIEKFEKEKLNIVEIIGVFVAFFTFISIEINIFRLPLNIWQLFGFSLLNLATVLFLVSSIQTLLRVEFFSKDNPFYKNVSVWFVGLSIIMSLISALVIHLGNQKESKFIFISKENDKNKYIFLENAKDIQEKLSEIGKEESASTTRDVEKLKKCISVSMYFYQVKNCIK